MGSYCSILDTDDVWSVKLGSVEAAINIATIIATVVGVAGTATAGAAAPLAAYLASNGVSVCGLSSAALATAAAGAGLVGVGVARAASGAAFTTTIANLIQKEVSKNLGLDRLAPGEKNKYGKMSLSLWQQGTCYRTRVNPENSKEIFVERLYMRPIFSGPADDSENVHEIQWWINKLGIEHVETIPCCT